MGPATPPVYGLVLSGGRSRRFGLDKAGITIEGQALLERMVTLLEHYCVQTFVSIRADQTGDELRQRFAVLVDAQRFSGPAAGLLAAHTAFETVAWLIVPCDLPLLDATSIERLMMARRADKAATAYRNPARGFPEPLCAIWEPATLAGLLNAAESGPPPSPRDWLADTDTVLIDAEDSRVLENMNTRDDYERLGLGDGHSAG